MFNSFFFSIFISNIYWKGNRKLSYSAVYFCVSLSTNAWTQLFRVSFPTNAWTQLFRVSFPINAWTQLFRVCFSTNAWTQLFRVSFPTNAWTQLFRVSFPTNAWTQLFRVCFSINAWTLLFRTQNSWTAFSGWESFGTIFVDWQMKMSLTSLKSSTLELLLSMGVVEKYWMSPRVSRGKWYRDAKSPAFRAFSVFFFFI